MLWLTAASRAQEIDPYRRLTNPAAIADLSGMDAEPQEHRWGVGWPAERDTNAHFIVAQASGAGIITHLWLQFQPTDERNEAFLKIWIDDSLVITENIHTFFRKRNKLFRPPLDTIQSGGLVCDVQMPYRRNFKVTFYAPWELCCVFWSITWRPVVDSNLVRSFRLDDPVLDEQQRRAEQAYWRGNPWEGRSAIVKTFSAEIERSGQLELASLNGPAMLQQLTFRPTTLDVEQLRNLWIKIYWDHSPHASVSAPFADFFGVGAGQYKVRALQLRASDGEFTCYLPMPFYRHARIVLENRSSTQIDVTGEYKFTQGEVDRDRNGYFHAVFVDNRPAIFGQPMVPAQWRGRGRFIGMHLMSPDAVEPYFLEGDAIMYIDSNDQNTIHYVGSEDYFNGGWFFSDGAMALPFGGCTNRWNSLYRFHYFDAIDFTTSFHFSLDHGDHNFWKNWFRTVAFLYTRWTPYWVRHDTVLATDPLVLGGSGYLSGEAINVYLNDSLVSTTVADANGTFDVSMIHQRSPGTYTLRVNTESRPIPVVVISQPALSLVGYIPKEFHWTDTVAVKGYGFREGERVRIYFDSTETVPLDSALTRDDHTFTSRFRIPWADNGLHTLSARGDSGSSAMLPYSLAVTRTLNFEIEDMWPPLSVEAFARPDYMGYFKGRWSQQKYLLFQPGEAGKSIVVPFYVPYTDTFDVGYYLTYGKRFGQYRVRLDGNILGEHECFQERELNDPIRTEMFSGGTRMLEQGQHTLTFTSLGKHSGTEEYLLGADNLVLTPMTPFDPNRFTLDTPQRPTPYSTGNAVVALYPNPSTQKMRIVCTVPTELGNPIELSLVDARGRAVANLFSGVPPLAMFVVERSLADLAAGAYFVLLRTADGRVLGQAQLQRY